VLERLVVPQVTNTPPAEEPEISLDAPTSAVTASEVGQMVAAAEPSRPDVSEPIAESASMPSLFVAESAPLPIARLFDALRVERGADGSLRIEAPPAAASALAALFEGMARLLSAVGGAPPTEAEKPRPSLPS
jgi:hypothetical protein